MEVKKLDCYSSLTKVQYCSVEYEWIIEDYNRVSKCLKQVLSPQFAASDDNERKWFFHLFFEEINEMNNEIVHIHLVRTDVAEVYVEVNLSFSCSSNRYIKTPVPFKSILRWNECIYIPLSNSDLVNDLDWNSDSNDSLILTCKIRTFSNIVNVKQNTLSYTESANLTNDISALLYDPSFKDVEFLVKGKLFRAHKNILASRSEVFTAMFKNKMNESLTSSVKIKDIEPKIFEQMLYFIYTDEVDLKKNTVFKLFAAAHKYNVKKLKQICIEKIYENLSINNVLETLQFVELYSISELQERTLEFLTVHLTELQNSKEFELFITTYPDIAVKIFRLQNKDCYW